MAGTSYQPVTLNRPCRRRWARARITKEGHEFANEPSWAHFQLEGGYFVFETTARVRHWDGAVPSIDVDFIMNGTYSTIARTAKAAGDTRYLKVERLFLRNKPRQ